MKRYTLLFLATTWLATPVIAKDSLYTRLGGYDGVAAVTDSSLQEEVIKVVGTLKADIVGH